MSVDPRPDSGANLAESEELRASIDHLASIGRQIDRLERAQRETVDQIAAAASRIGPITFQEADALYAELRAKDVPGRKAIMLASGWHPAQITQTRRDGIPPRGSACVYLLLDGTDVAYVGHSTNVRQRLKAHRKEKAGRWDDFQIFMCANVNDARDLEAVLIDQHKPRLNRRTEKRVVA